MTASDYWQRVEEIFHSALEREPGQRTSFLSQACQSNPEMIAEVQDLLLAYEKSGNFLKPPDLASTFAQILDASPESMIGQSLSRFKVLSLLGKGGMGEVYLAEDMKLGRKVAIKSLPARLLEDDHAKKRLMREARAAARLDHPNICAIYEIGEEDNHSFIVMQYIEGDTLSNKIQGHNVKITESVDIAMQIADALSSAHSSGIIHRDIKPQNIVISHEGQVKVLDFGLVKVLPGNGAAQSGQESQSLVTERGAIVGTAAYMSPEQVKNAPLNASSDLFSLGALLYECLTSRPAFSGNNFMEICAQVIHVTPPPPSALNSTISPELDRIVLKALAKDPAARYQSAFEILTDLRHARDTLQAGENARKRPFGLSMVEARAKARQAWNSLLYGRNFRIALIILPLVALALWVGSFIKHGSAHQPPPEAQRLFEMGKSALCDGTYYQASKALTRAISLDNEFPLAHARLAEAWAEMDYPDRAKDELLFATAQITDRGAMAESDRLYLDAIAATIRRDFSTALNNYRQIVELASGPDKALGYVELGRAYQKNEEAQHAIESYQEAIKYDPEYAGAYLRLGILYGRQQNLDKAGEYFDKAETIYQALSNNEGITEVLFQRGYLFNSVDKIGEAKEHLEKALDFAQMTSNNYQRIRILLQMSSLACTQGQPDQARQFADEAIALTQAENTDSLAANGMIDLGNSFFVKGEYADAQKYFSRAIEFAERSRSRRSEARGLLSLGSLLIQQGNTDEGLRSVEQALAFYQQGGYKKETSQALILVARGNRQKGFYDVALQAFEQQLHLAQEIGDQSLIAYSHSSIGILLGDYQERYAEALGHFEESYKINNMIGAKLNSGYDLMNTGGILWQVGKGQEAQASLNQAAALANNPDARYKQLLASVHLAMSRLELSEGRGAQARANSQQAFDLAEGNSKDLAAQAMCERGLALAQLKMSREGKSLCEEAVARLKDLGNPRLLSKGMMALAEASLLTGDFQGATAAALEAQTRFANQGAKDSEWRAWLIAACAAEGSGDAATASTYAARAAAALSDLQNKIGEEYYKTYLERPDIKNYRKQLDKALAANK